MRKVFKKGVSFVLAASIAISPAISLASNTGDSDNIVVNEDVIPYYVNSHKNISFYESSQSKKAIKNDIAFKYFQEENEDSMYIIGDRPIENEKEILDMAANFVDKFVPQRMRDLRVFMFPYDISMVNGYFVEDNPKAIVLAHDDPYTFYHEFGHFVWDFYLNEIQSEEEYSEMVKENILKGNGSGSTWDYKISESFAEDFKSYILFSIYGKKLNDLRIDKRTSYPLNDKVFYQFDKMFPAIKNHREIYYPEKEKEYIKRFEKLMKHNEERNKKIHSKWSKKEIDYFYNNGYSIKEKDLKKPVTREIFAEALVKLYENRGGDIIESTETFVDTNNQYIEKCAALGIVQGVGEGYFLPNKSISRKDMYIMIDRFQKLSKTKIEVDRSIVNRDTSIEEAIAILNRFDFKLKNRTTIKDYNWYNEQTKKSLQ